MKTPAVKAFKATYQGRYTLRDSDGDALSMTAMETITDLLLEIMEVTCPVHPQSMHNSVKPCVMHSIHQGCLAVLSCDTVYTCIYIL